MTKLGSSESSPVIGAFCIVLGACGDPYDEDESSRMIGSETGEYYGSETSEVEESIEPVTGLDVELNVAGVSDPPLVEPSASEVLSPEGAPNPDDLAQRRDMALLLPHCTHSQWVQMSSAFFKWIDYPMHDGVLDRGVCMMAQGAQGNAVTALQWALSRCGHQAITIDGIYGSQTSQAVRNVQQRGGVTVDGIWGPETRRVLRWPHYSAARHTATVACL